MRGIRPLSLFGLIWVVMVSMSTLVLAQSVRTAQPTLTVPLSLPRLMQDDILLVSSDWAEPGQVRIEKKNPDLQTDNLERVVDPEIIWDFTCLLDWDALYRESAGDPRVLQHVFEQAQGEVPLLQAGWVFCTTAPVPAAGVAVPAGAVTVDGSPSALTNPPKPVPGAAWCTQGIGTTCTLPNESCALGCGTCIDTYHLTTGKCDCRCD